MNGLNKILVLVVDIFTATVCPCVRLRLYMFLQLYHLLLGAEGIRIYPYISMPYDWLSKAGFHNVGNRPSHVRWSHVGYYL